MAHELTSTDHMFSGNRKKPWHGIGTVVEGLLTADEAIRTAKLDWIVDKVPMVCFDGKEIKSHVATRRADTGDILGVVGKDWTPVQNFEAFNFFDGVVASREAIYESAGSLRGGSRVWLLAKLPEPMVLRNGIQEDVTEKYLLLSNGHDGTLSLSMMFTPVRVVCSNTLNVALSTTGSKFKAPHRTGIHVRIEEAREVLGMAIKYYDVLGQGAQVLTDRQISSAEFTWYVNTMFPIKENATQRGITRTENTRTTVRNLMEAETQRNIRGTAWGAFNCVTEYADWARNAQTEDKRLDRVWFGVNDIKQNAWNLAMNLAENKVQAG